MIVDAEDLQDAEVREEGAGMHRRQRELFQSCGANLPLIHVRENEPFSFDAFPNGGGGDSLLQGCDQNADRTLCSWHAIRFLGTRFDRSHLQVHSFSQRESLSGFFPENLAICANRLRTRGP